MILLPAATVRVACKGELSALTVFQTRQILNLGGKLIFVNCGVAS